VRTMRYDREEVYICAVLCVRVCVRVCGERRSETEVTVPPTPSLSLRCSHVFAIRLCVGYKDIYLLYTRMCT
jgi:hypothetical protein